VPASRTVAFDLLKEAGGRLNHRVVSVLTTIDAEPGLSNAEICERLGLQSKGHVSVLLARLARFGLIENQTLDTAPFQANAWQLTANGKQLKATIHHNERSIPTRSPRDRHSTQIQMSSPAHHRIASYGDPR
jgi:DNA-binding MarR family transcriptional regulator